MEIKASDIKLFAKLGYLFYADGYSALILGMKPAKDQQEEDVWEFLLDPSSELIKRYNLKVQNLSISPNFPMAYIAQYPYDLVLQLNVDPAWTRYLYLRTYEGGVPPEMKRIEGFDYKKFEQRLGALEINKETKDRIKDIIIESKYSVYNLIDLYMKTKQQTNELMMQLEVKQEQLGLLQKDMPKYLDRNFKPMLDQFIPVLEKIFIKSVVQH